MAATGDVIPYHAEIIKGDVGEVGAAGAIADGPHALGCGLQAFIDFHKSAFGRFHAG